MTRELTKQAYQLYDKINDNIREENNRVYACPNHIERLKCLATRAHFRYMRRRTGWPHLGYY
jgi:transcription initiation factor IIE alpha subunit